MYKVEFVKSALDDKNIAKKSKCILSISMGVEAYEDYKLIAILSLINKTFSECKIIVGDTLHRHNTGFESDQEKLNSALKKGDEWLNRNFTYFIRELKIPFQIIRWDSFLRTPGYQEYYDVIESKYNNDSNYHQIFNETAKEFLSRKDRSGEENAAQVPASLAYLKEEAAAMCLWPELACEYEVYYNKRNGVTDLIYRDILKTQYPNLLQPLSLRFKKQKVFKDVVSVANTFALNHLIEIMPGHIFWKNKDGVYLGCNLEQVKYYGFDAPEEVINKTDNEIMGERIGNMLRENDLMIMKQNKIVTLEEENNGEFFLSSKTAIRDSNGNAVGIIGCAVNITQQKLLEAKLRKQTDLLSKTVLAKDRFLNNLSHEIKTPLHIISALTEELHQNFSQISDNEKFGYIELLNSTTQKLLKFVQNILILAKAKKRDLKGNFEATNLVDLVMAVIDEIKVISPAEISLVVSGDQKIIASCTATQIEQVIRNLLENAIKYGNNKPIRVKIENDESEVKIAVIDQGIAVPDDEKLKIFEAFEEGSRTKSMAGGTGLGLAICKDILNLHKGKIWVESKDGVGSKFVFTLPLSN
jgi:tRNA-dependent cyclodipeptide synthase